MYNLNTDRIESVLLHLEERLRLLRTLINAPDADILSDQTVVAAIERALHTTIEAIVDTGNALIDGFIMRDPGSYTDIVEILRDERVLDDQSAAVLTELVAFRKELVHNYTDVPQLEMIRLVRVSLDSLARFSSAVRQYIKQELF
ncbi:DUF86 domain-containing protein [Brevibacillus humidisoli]|uniref:type VII toxin-antitoxin system HepT family RNase toxin n=1 Tax=Brevibacillus humidisoli TaxID=2895522 RepID=UPI001E58FF63|nr:HepT-like ribonuclease domain-containing protein [Brevibacillus humidisoli]UFJ39678.1 DUF86 domain-containing protein [Brevibacillus humidisoli]